MITLLNKSMIYSIFAVLIPVIIHFIVKSKTKTVKFPAIIFLKQTIKKQYKKLRYSSFLLMFTRCLIILSISLAVMQPIITNSKDKFKHQSYNHYVIIMDTSLSTQLYSNSSNSTMFQALKHNMLYFLDNLTSNDKITFFTTDQNGTMIGKPFEHISDHYINKIEQTVKAGFFHADLFKVYQRAYSLLSKLEKSNSSIIIFSDFQETNFKQLSLHLKNSKNQHQVLLCSSDQTYQESKKNIFISEVASPLQTILNKNEMTLKINLKSDTEQPSNLKLFRNKILYEEFTHHNKKNSQITQTTIMNTSKGIPITQIEAKIYGDNVLFDNVFYAILEKQDPVNILILGSESQLNKSYLVPALNPYHKKNIINKTPFKLNFTSNLSKIEKLNKFNILILTDISNLNNIELKQITQFLEDGGNIIAALDYDQNNSSYLHSIQQNHNLNQILPFEAKNIKIIKNLTKQQLELSFEGKKIFKQLNDKELWNNLYCNTIFKVNKKEYNYMPIINTISKIPFMIIYKKKKGYVTLFLSSLKNDNSNIVTNSIFLPLIHQTCDYLIKHKKKKLFYRVGKKIYLSNYSNDYHIKNPAGITIKNITINNDHSYFIPDMPGFYHLYHKNNLINKYAVNTSAKESTLNFIDISKWSAHSNILKTKTKKELISFLQTQNKMISFWQIFLWLALILIFVEQIIISRIRK